MPKRISKLVREEAAMLCAIAASTPELAEAYILVAVHLGWTRRDHKGRATSRVKRTLSDAYSLAIAAWEVADKHRLGRPFVDAEAECLLRCGWSPGDGGTP